MPFEMSISLEDVAVRRAGRLIVDGVSMALAPGDAVMIRGGNGSGKTSLLRAIAGLAQHDGDITFRRDIQVLDPAFIRSEEIHLVSPEGGHNPRLTVEEAVRFDSRFLGGDSDEALVQLGLALQAETRVGDLSTGQRRRLSLLRLVLRPKALWLLDEPFSGLDAEGREIVKAMVQIQRGRGGIVCVALHDPEDLPRARTLFVEAA